MNCEICNKDSGSESICLECNTLKEQGKITKCQKCGKWKKNDKPLCYKCWTETRKQTTPSLNINKSDSSEKQKIQIKQNKPDETDIYRGMSYAEKEVAEVLSNLNILCIHEAPVCIIDAAYEKRTWFPTFFLPQFGIYIEVCADKDPNYESKKQIYELNNIIVIFVKSYGGQIWKKYLLNQLLEIEQYRLSILFTNLYSKVYQEFSETDIKENKTSEVISELDFDYLNFDESLKKTRSTYPNAYKLWTKPDDAQLTKLFTEGKKISELAEIFQRQPGAIRSRLNKLGLLIF